MSQWSTPTTFAKVWERSVAAHGHDTFLIFEGPDGQVAQWSYAEFDTCVSRVAARLVAQGVVEGSGVHLALTNCPTFVAVWVAANRLGAWIVPSDPMSKAPELRDHIERTQPVVGLCSTERSGEYRRAAPTGLSVIEIDEADVDFSPFPSADFVDWATPDLDHRAAVMFTSGTTGRPKGVEVTQANYAFAAKTMAAACDLAHTDRQIVVLPLFHANAQYYSFASAIWVGASVALMHTFSASGFLAQAARHRATCASLFAAPIRMILARGEPVTGVSLRHCWFAQNLAQDQYEKISEWFECRPRQLYGMTETIPAVLTDTAAGACHDSMGYVTTGCEVEVHDTDGRPCAPDTVGELVVRGEPGVTLFGGYLDDPRSTADSFDDGWFRTGDRASRNLDGRFFFDGRRSDVLKVAGENVSTVEVEGVLTAHPGVLEATVLGAPDEIRDEVPVAFVVPTNPGAPPTLRELEQWCTDHLSKAKRPREITFLDELPRTSVGKIRKFLLQDTVSKEKVSS